MPSRRQRFSSVTRPMVTWACQARASIGTPRLSSVSATRACSRCTSCAPSETPDPEGARVLEAGEGAEPLRLSVKVGTPEAASSRADTTSGQLRLRLVTQESERQVEVVGRHPGDDPGERAQPVDLRGDSPPGRARPGGRRRRRAASAAASRRRSMSSAALGRLPLDGDAVAAEEAAARLNAGRRRAADVDRADRLLRAAAVGTGDARDGQAARRSPRCGRRRPPSPGRRAR